MGLYPKEKLQSLINELDKLAYSLLLYAGPNIGGKSIELNLALRKTITAKDKNDINKAISIIETATQEWLKTYVNEIRVYKSQSMPDKWKIDIFGPILSKLLDM